MREIKKIILWIYMIKGGLNKYKIWWTWTKRLTI